MIMPEAFGLGILPGNELQLTMDLGVESVGGHSAGQKSPVVIDARIHGYETAHSPGARHPKFGDFFTGGTGLLPVVGLNNKLSAAIRSNTQFMATPRLPGIRTRHLAS